MTRGNPLKFGMTVSTSTWVISSGFSGRNAAALLPSGVLIIVILAESSISVGSTGEDLYLHGMYIVYTAHTLSAHYIYPCILGANEVYR